MEETRREAPAQPRATGQGFLQELTPGQAGLEGGRRVCGFCSVSVCTGMPLTLSVRFTSSVSSLLFLVLLVKIS